MNTEGEKDRYQMGIVQSPKTTSRYSTNASKNSNMSKTSSRVNRSSSRAKSNRGSKSKKLHVTTSNLALSESRNVSFSQPNTPKVSIPNNTQAVSTPISLHTIPECENKNKNVYTNVNKENNIFKK